MARSALGLCPGSGDLRTAAPQAVGRLPRCLPGSQSAWKAGPCLVYRSANVRLSAWELVCHAVADEDIAGQRLFRVVRECPLSTPLDSPVEHATGTLTPLEAVDGTCRADLLIPRHV